MQNSKETKLKYKFKDIHIFKRNSYLIEKNKLIMIII